MAQLYGNENENFPLNTIRIDLISVYDVTMDYISLETEA